MSAHRISAEALTATAMVADDNTDARSTLACVLELLGHTVVQAADGSEALARAAEFHPRVIFLDLGMPGLDGWQVCEHIRGMPWGARAWIVAVSGYGLDQDRQRSMAAGFNKHCTKPLDIRTVQELLLHLPSIVP